MDGGGTKGEERRIGEEEFRPKRGKIKDIVNIIYIRLIYYYIFIIIRPFFKPCPSLIYPCHFLTPPPLKITKLPLPQLLGLSKSISGKGLWFMLEGRLFF